MQASSIKLGAFLLQDIAVKGYNTPHICKNNQLIQGQIS